MKGKIKNMQTRRADYLGHWYSRYIKG